MRRWLWSCAVLGGAAFAGCSSFSDSAVDTHGSSFDGPGTATGTNAGGSSSSSISNGGTSATTAPEQEEAPTFRAPVVSGHWVWTANPDTGKVAIVDAKNFTVRLADAGAAPTFLTAIPSAAGTSEALVINVGSHDATELRAGDSGPVTALAPVPIAPKANTWTVSKTGKFAVAWTDSTGTTPDPAESFQDVSVVDLRGAAPVSTRLVVGILPSRVFIDDAETTAYVVATTGITVIDLTAASAPRVRVEEPVSDLHDDATTRDVSVMPDGSYALIRHEGSAVVTLLELSSGKLSEVTLSGPVTDLDLAPDARSALAVVRAQPSPMVQAPPPSTAEAGAGGDGGASNGGAGGSGESAGGAPSIPSGPLSTLAILPIPGIFAAPTAFDTVSIDEVFGLVNIAAQGTVALLYTNALPSSRITLLQTAPGPSYATHRTVDVRGNVLDVFPSPDGSYAIASLQANSGGKPGFAAIPVTAELPVRVQTTVAPVFAVAQSGGAQPRAVVTVSDGAQQFAAYVVRMPELVVDQVLLPSRPLAGGTGIVPDAGVAYIAETHPEGRITFIDLETGVPRTITGFEISAKVIDGN